MWQSNGFYGSPRLRDRVQRPRRAWTVRALLKLRALWSAWCATQIAGSNWSEKLDQRIDVVRAT